MLVFGESIIFADGDGCERVTGGRAQPKVTGAPSSVSELLRLLLTRSLCGARGHGAAALNKEMYSYFIQNVLLLVKFKIILLYIPWYGKYSDPFKCVTLCFIAAIC